MNVAEAFKQLREARQFLNDYFDNRHGWEAIEDMTSEEWYWDEPKGFDFRRATIWWDQIQMGDFGVEGCYESEVVAVYEKEDYTMVVVRDSCGRGNYCQVFDNSKKFIPPENP